jgi:hypothetical protein
MPRLVPGAPSLAVSLDTLFLAIARSGELALWGVASRSARGSVELPEADEVDVVFVGNQRLVAFARRGDATRALAFRVPGLEPIAQLELAGAVRPLATVGDRMLVANEAGEQARIVYANDRALGLDPISVREPVQFAVAAPEDRMLIAARDQLEAWDPVYRRALFRINLPLSSPRFAGFCARRRLLWVASATRMGELVAYRFSDGRMTTRAELGRRILGAHGHPESPRLVVAARPDEQQPIEMFQLDFSIDERFAVPLGSAQPESFVMADGATPSVVIAGRDSGPDFISLPRAVPLEELAPTPAPLPRSTANARPPRSPHQPPARMVAPSRPATAPAADGDGPSWRDRLGHVPPPSTSSAPKPARAAARPSSPQPQGEPFDDPADAEERRPLERVAGHSWRNALAAWGAALLGGADDVPAPPNGTPVAALAARLQLGGAAEQALALLYAGWLLGDGRTGLAAAALANLIDEDPDSAWTEALGLGALGRSGLVRPRDGRLYLRPVAGRFLDGHAPPVAIVPAGAEPHGPEAGSWYVAAAEPRALAERLGRAVATVDLSPRPLRRFVPSGVVAARLHDAVPLIVLAASDAGAWLPLVGPELALVTGPGGSRGLSPLPT